MTRSVHYTKARSRMLPIFLVAALLVGLLRVNKKPELSSDRLQQQPTHPREANLISPCFILQPNNSAWRLRDDPIKPDVVLHPGTPVWRPSVVNNDDLKGKSCRSVESHWQCRDCGLDGNFTQWQDCPLLERANICEDVNTTHYDSPRPRTSSYLDFSSHQTINILSRAGLKGPDTRPQIKCSDDLTDCFNLTKCRDNALLPGMGPINVYAYGPEATGNLSLAAEQYPDSVRLVTDPSQACLLVVFCDAFDTPEELWNSSSWNSGINHFIWRANECFDAVADHPFSYVNYGFASLASPSFTDSSVRKGYDVPTAYPNENFMVSFDIPSLVNQTMGHERRWLVSFKGNIYTRWIQPWWQHRWLAANYWNQTDPTIAVDVTCNKKTNYTDKYPDYVNLLMNSTFAFCPGGGSPQSYRFMEALALGAIPVVTPDLLTPLYPHLDWSGCVVRVTGSRIVDLPRLLGEISPDDVRLRQKRCHDLFQLTLAWMPNPNDSQTWMVNNEQSFITSMRIWSWRIHNALQKQQAWQDLELEMLLQTNHR